MRDGVITFDLTARTLNLSVSPAELTDRLATCRRRRSAPSGVMGKYARLVSSAAQGAITA